MLSSGGGKLSVSCGRGAANDSGLPRPSPSAGGTPHCELRWGRAAVLKGGENIEEGGRKEGKMLVSVKGKRTTTK